VGFAQPVPTFSTHEYCDRKASLSAPYSQLVYVDCTNVELEARAALETGWPSVLGRARQYCIEQATVGGLGSYPGLRTCLAAPIPPTTPAPARSIKFFLRVPSDREGTPFDTMQECLAARERLGSQAAACIGR